MAKIPIVLSPGLRFSERNAENSRFSNVSYTSKPGVLSTRKSHTTKFNIASRPQKILYSKQQNKTFVLSVNGNISADGAVIDTGYSTTGGTLIELLPNQNLNSRQLFIAGSAKMQKYDGTTFTKWGIDDPPAAALTAVFGGIVGTNIINTCDDKTTWTAVGCVLADEPTIKQSGTNSLKITLAAATAASITHTFSVVKDLRIPQVVGFYIRFTDPTKLQKFTMSFDLANDGFLTNTAHRDYGSEFQPSFPATVSEISSGTVPQEMSGNDNSDLVDQSMTRVSLLPSTANQWKHVLVSRDSFPIIGTNGWQNVYAIKIELLSSVAQDVYLDIIYFSTINQDDAQGARYKYAYYNSSTQHHGNLNSTPTQGVIGQNGIVNVTGFVAPTDAQVTDYQIYRDVGGDGNYRAVGLLPKASATFVDSIPINDLGDLDTNDNSPPPSATLAVDYKGSVWLNDTTNPRRLWRSVPGEYESFAITKDSGFFDVSVVGDEIIDIGVVRGILFLVTRRSIIQVLAPELVPSFVEVVTLGAVGEPAVYSFKDFFVFVSNTGVFIFDTANLKQLPHIESLFNPLSSDSRAITTANISTITVGSDSKHIWLSVDTSKMYVYAVDSQQWVEESPIFVAHETDQIGFLHIAASIATVYDVYGSGAYEIFSLRTDVVELPTIGHVNDIELEYYSTVDLTLNVIVDSIVVKTVVLDSNIRRTWNFINLVDVLGQQLEIELIGSTNGLVELYSCQANYTPLTDLSHYDSEYFKLPDERTAITELFTKIYGLIDGELEARVFVDDKVSRIILVPVKRNKISTLRHVIKPLVGTVCRVDIRGVRYYPMSLSLNVIILGSGERRNIQLGLNKLTTARISNDTNDAKTASALEGLV